VVTATTLGSGDVVPRNEFAKKLVIAQLAISLFFVLVIVNALISRMRLGRKLAELSGPVSEKQTPQADQR
jgi:hypothetical protein